jgi:hypothetical protein
MDSSTFPINYRGVDVAELATALSPSQGPVKDEFETTEQFRHRVHVMNSGPILGSLKLDSVYAFSFYPTRTEYDADHRKLTVVFESMYCCDVGGHFNTYYAFPWQERTTKGQSYPAQNSFGAGVEVESEYVQWDGVVIRNLHDLHAEVGGVYASPKLIFRIPIDPEKAKDLKSKIMVMLICKLEKPYLSLSSSKSPPTVKVPVERTEILSFVHVDVLRAMAYDLSSGTVYSTQESGKARQ